MPDYLIHPTFIAALADQSHWLLYSHTKLIYCYSRRRTSVRMAVNFSRLRPIVTHSNANSQHMKKYFTTYTCTSIKTHIYFQRGKYEPWWIFDGDGLTDIRFPFGGISDSASPSTIRSGPYRNGGSWTSGHRVPDRRTMWSEAGCRHFHFISNKWSAKRQKMVVGWWAQYTPRCNVPFAVACMCGPIALGLWLWCHSSTRSYTFSPYVCLCVNQHQLHVYLWIRNEKTFRLPNNSNCHFECGRPPRRRPNDEPEDEIYRIYNTYLFHIRHNLLLYFFFTFSGLKIAAWWSNSKANNECSFCYFVVWLCGQIARPFVENDGGGHLVNIS